jgi:hypothetical protein
LNLGQDEVIFFQNAIFEQATQVSDAGAWIHIPRLAISAGMEMNAAYKGGRDINWMAIIKDDPRLKESAWYAEGRETPPIGKKKLPEF